MMGNELGLKDSPMEYRVKSKKKNYWSYVPYESSR